MANISTTDFYIDVPSLSREQFEEYSISLFDDWESRVKTTLILPDYSLLLNVEEGSITGAAKLIASPKLIRQGAAKRNSFISGIEDIECQVNDISNHFGQRAGELFKFGSAKPIVKVKKRKEVPTKLLELFEKFRRNEITVKQAIVDVEAIFGSEFKDDPEFEVVLKDALEQTPLQQMYFPFREAYVGDAIPNTKKNRKTSQKKPRKQPDPKQYRVQVRRESITSKRTVKIINLLL